MNRPPRDPRVRLLSGSVIRWGVAQGLFALFAVAGVYVLALNYGMPADEVRAFTFLALVVTNIALIFANRAFGASLRAAMLRPNPSLWWGIAGVAVLIGVVLLWPPLAAVFGLGRLAPAEFAIAFGVSALLLVGLELIKAVLHPRLRF